MSAALRRVGLGTAALLIAALQLAQAGCAGEGNNNTGSCSAATCPAGCCMQGQCVLGNTQQACGKGGAPCTACGSGTTCSAGACTTGGQSCNPTTCPQGCCAGGVCLPIGAQQNGAQCGTGGQACISCGTAMCASGVCQGSSTCNAATCADGCCTAQGQCLQHNLQSATQCGTAGATCAPCSGGQCAQGRCSSSACNQTNCTGCCTAQGQCLLPGPQQGAAACGTAAAPCMPCAAPGLCTNGICSGAGSCSPGTCGGGCCSGNTCLLPAQQTATACGLNGAGCQPCPAQSPACNAGVCQACGPASCPGGCCSGQQCILFAQQGKTACGKGGLPCAQCQPGQTCYDNTCMTAWKVSAISAVVVDKPSSDPWDPSGSLTGPLPDPQLRCRANATGKEGTSKFIDDTLTPAWGRQELFVEAEQSLASGITCTVQDDDGLFDANMGDCNFPTLSAVQLAGGSLTSGAGSCSSYVTSVTIGFDKLP